MSITTLLINTYQSISDFDPSPFFVLSLFPYLAFLYWARKSNSIPKVALWGFQLTLLFVLMTIVLAIVASARYGSELTEIDPLHGAAEAFLTASDGLVALGFLRVLNRKEVNNS